MVVLGRDDGRWDVDPLWQAVRDHFLKGWWP